MQTGLLPVTRTMTEYSGAAQIVPYACCCHLPPPVLASGGEAPTAADAESFYCQPSECPARRARPVRTTTVSYPLESG